MNKVISKHRISEDRKEKIPHSALDVYLSREGEKVFLFLEVFDILELSSQYYPDMDSLRDSNVVLRFKPKNGSFIKVPGSHNLGNIFDFAKNPVAKIEVSAVEILEHIQLDLSITRQSDKFKMLFVENLRIKGFSKRDQSFNTSSFIQGRVDEDLNVIYKTVVTTNDMPCVYFSVKEKMNGRSMLEDPMFGTIIANEVFYKMTKVMIDFDAESNSLNERSDWMKMWWNCLKQAAPKECQSYEIEMEDGIQNVNSIDLKSEIADKLTIKYREFIKSDLKIFANWIKFNETTTEDME